MILELITEIQSLHALNSIIFCRRLDGHVSTFVVAEKANMPWYTENVEAFIRQIQVE
jgi:hypothetical protein